MFSIVPEEYLELIEEEIEPLLERAAGRTNGFYSIYDLIGFIYGKSHQLWIVADDDSKRILAILMTTIRESLKKRILDLQFAASVEDSGSLLKDFREVMNDELDNFAVINNCDAIQIEGRRGWKKVMEPVGYKEVAVVLEKEVTHG